MAEERWRISVDRDVCQGTGMCTSVAARYFVLEGGHAKVIEPEVDADDEIVDAAESCPVEAILVTSTEDGRTVAPEPY